MQKRSTLTNFAELVCREWQIIMSYRSSTVKGSTTSNFYTMQGHRSVGRRSLSVKSQAIRTNSSNRYITTHVHWPLAQRQSGHGHPWSQLATVVVRAFEQVRSDSQVAARHRFGLPLCLCRWEVSWSRKYDSQTEIEGLKSTVGVNQREEASASRGVAWEEDQRQDV